MISSQKIEHLTDTSEQVPPFFLPLYSISMGLSSKTAAALVAAFNFSSAIGRIGAGFAADRLGSLNTYVHPLSPLSKPQYSHNLDSQPPSSSTA